MATTAIEPTRLTGVAPVPSRLLTAVEEEAARRQQQRPAGRGALLQLPEDQVTLSEAAVQEQREPSREVTAAEKTALLGDQKRPRLSVRI